MTPVSSLMPQYAQYIRRAGITDEYVDQSIVNVVVEMVTSENRSVNRWASV